MYRRDDTRQITLEVTTDDTYSLQIFAVRKTHIVTSQQSLTRPIVVDSAQLWRALTHSSRLDVVGTRTGSDGEAIRHDFARHCTMTLR